ncbi:MAG: 3-dehydroquinate synthase [Candidatus Anammoxibacter sp.]
MKDIFVNLGADSYNIKIGQQIIKQIDALLPNNIKSDKVVIITDENVAGLYLDLLVSRLVKCGFSVKHVSIVPGEDRKNSATVEKLYEVLFDHQMDRKSFVIALGGGVVGDLAGFVASTFMRGIPYIQIPTTLLAQVDSSVGGKTGFNHPRGKNMIGCFYQPKGVFIDTDTLTTLPKEELTAGLVEVIKYGMIRSKPLFEYLENELSNILQLRKEALEHIIFTSCCIKARVVEEDEKENGIRAILNYGHTIGHAVEALTCYSQYRHGEAVGIGMVYAGKIAKEMGIVDDDAINRQMCLLEKLGIPTTVTDLSTTEIVKKLYQDKKTIGGKLRFVLPVQIGEVVISDNVPEDIIHKVLVSSN